MDSFKVNSYKVQKENVTLKHLYLRKLANLFRIIEICVILVIVSRFSTQLPLAVKNSGKFQVHDSSRKSPGDDFYKEFVEKSKKNENTHRHEVKYREKQSKSKENIVSVGTHSSSKTKICRRNQSEKSKSVNGDKSCRELRRLSTEKYKKSTGSEDRVVKNSSPVDNMSNEEFQQMIEAFIARQHKFRITEEHSMI